MFVIVTYQAACLNADSLEDIVNETIHDGHRSLRNACFWVHLLQNSVDVN